MQGVVYRRLLEYTDLKSDINTVIPYCVRALNHLKRAGFSGRGVNSLLKDDAFLDTLVCLVAHRQARVILANRIEKAYSYRRRISGGSVDSRVQNRFRSYLNRLSYMIPTSIVPRCRSLADAVKNILEYLEYKHILPRSLLPKVKEKALEIVKEVGEDISGKKLSNLARNIVKRAVGEVGHPSMKLEEYLTRILG